MRKLAFFVGYGLLPFWAATAIVLIGAAFYQSSDYWTAAPWLVVFSIPICGATLLAAAITLIVYASADGDASRKKAVATKWFWALNALLIGIASKKRVSGTISRRVAVRCLFDSPLLQTSGNSYFLSEVLDTLQSLP